MSIKAVIWDLGGVLVRTEDYAPRNALADRLGVQREDLERLVFLNESGMCAQRGEITLERHWQSIQARFGLTSKELSSFLHDFFAGDVLDQELLYYIRTLRPAYKVGLLSNAFENVRHLVTEVWAFADIFDDMVISAEVGMVKPDPRIYLHALERLQVPAYAAVFVDDSLPNIESARALGLHGLHFRSPLQARQDLEEILNHHAPG